MPFSKIFVGGAARSGTTWVNAIFLRHPQVCGLKQESEVFQTILTPFFEKTGSNRVLWGEVLKRYRTYVRIRGTTGVFGNRKEFRSIITESRQKTGTNIEAAFFAIRCLLERFYGNALNPGKTCMVEKTPANLLIAPIILNCFTEAKFIEVVRDGRDVVTSSLFRFPGGASAAQLMAKWVHYICLGDALNRMEKFAGRVLRVRYEDLLSHHQDTVEKLLSFAGLSITPEIVKDIVAATEFERHKHDYPWSSRKGIVGDWRTQLSDEDKKVAHLIGGDLLKSLGYS